MTYGVPYSFVPGTKARADEVNANFIDVLNKIDTVDSKVTSSTSEISERIDDEVSTLDTKIDAVDAANLNLSLSNINADGQKLFDAKANASLLDGAWYTGSKQIVAQKSITPGVTQTYSLASYFPDSTNLYEFILDGLVETSGTVFIYIETDKTGGICAFRTISKHAGMQSIMLTGAGRTLKVVNQSGSSGTSKYTLIIKGYRKVR